MRNYEANVREYDSNIKPMIVYLQALGVFFRTGTKVWAPADAEAITRYQRCASTI